MSFGSTSLDNALVTFVASAEPGSHEDASLSLTSVSFAPRTERPTVAARTRAATTHFVTGPVSFPAICRCMETFQQRSPTTCLRDLPDLVERGCLVGLDLRAVRPPG